MNLFRVRLKLRSALGTPLVADTLFGHLCWGIVYHEGKTALQKFLAAFRDGHPPLVLSDPLPADHWPMPVLAPPSPDAYDALLEEFVTNDRVATNDRIREALRRPWISHDLWRQQVDGLDAAAVVRTLLRDEPLAPSLPESASVAHNSINRLTGRTLDEGGFFFDQQFFPPAPLDYDVWTRTSFDGNRVRQLFEWSLATGYGRDAGIGKGHLTVESVEPAELPAVDAANGVMTLGTCAPAATDPTDGLWNIDVRHGKLGGPFANVADDTPFKFPVLFLARGAVFRTDRSVPVLGRIVENVHPTRPEVVTSGLTLTLPCHLTEEAVPCQPTI